jgi:undecaprenyl-diphosphatase
VSDLLKAIILGIVEGVTEFLPISSTGHLVLCEKWMGVNLAGDPFWKMFVVFIQIGAIASVVVYFHERIIALLRGPRDEREPDDATSTSAPPVPGGAERTATVLEARPRIAQPLLARHHALVMIAVGSLPLLIAYFAHRWAEQNLESPRMIAGALGIGGVLMILIEHFRPTVRTPAIEQMNWRQALGIGLAQIVAALFPGTSRSAATIMGGEIAGLSRPAAAEFSFFLAIPAMAAACTFSLLKHIRSGPGLDAWHTMLLGVGTLVSFAVAWAVIAAFMSFIRRHSFVPFAVYRIALAIVVLLVFR